MTPIQTGLRYRAALPWLGPIVGGKDGNFVPVGAGADPVIGKAFAALLVPIDSSGQRGGPGWFTHVDSDEGGRFALRVPGHFWTQGGRGLLLVLLYDLTRPARAVSAAGGAFTGIPQLRDDVREEIERRLRELFSAAPERLEPGTVELDGRSDPDSLVIAVGSCQYPAGFLDRHLAERSYRRLARWLDRDGRSLRPHCLLLLGDQVYLDATAGLFDPSALYDRYELPYERLLTAEAVRQVMRRLPTYTMLDDHEIENNWEPGSGSDENLARGIHWYRVFQRLAGPTVPSPKQLWYEFEVNGFPFFMADTRTQRGYRSAANVTGAHILGDDQLAALEKWLDDHRAGGRPMFIASPSAFLPRHRRAIQSRPSALHSDAWDGYPASLETVIAKIARDEIKNLYFLSGDEHISFASRATIRRGGAEVGRFASIHSSGLYSPFTFANSALERLANPDVVKVGGYDCEVRTESAPPGDGFTVLHIFRRDGGWAVRARFLRRPRPARAKKWIDLA